jgi:hypothetical protein
LLHWKNSEGSRPWSTGSALVHLDEEHSSGTLPVAVWCQFGSLPPELAMLDTGSEYTVIELLGNELGAPLDERSLSTRVGRFQGHLHRLDIHLIPQQGQRLTISSTLGVYPEWNGPSVLGYKGFLDRFRFALEPEGQGTPGQIHFGELTTLVPAARRRR